MAQINIQVIIDAETLASTDPGGTWDKPISLNEDITHDSCIYMLTQRSAIISGQGTSELYVRANVGDELIWTTNSIDDGILYNVTFYNAEISSDSISMPTCLFETYNNTQLVSGGSGDQPVFVQFESSADVWSSVASDQARKTTYTFYFAVIDADTNDVIGYYMWSAFVGISN